MIAKPRDIDLLNITGKDEYEFGDVTKKVLCDLFGNRKRGGGGSN